MKKIIRLCLLVMVFVSCSKEKRSDKASVKMQEFVIDISDYGRSINPNFIIIPQNGIELAFSNCDPEEGFNSTYMAAIDGVGIESLFYEGIASEDDGRLAMARTIRNSLKMVLVSDFMERNEDIPNAIQLNKDEGFICFPRNSTNYDYMYIPDSTIDENANDIHTLSDAKNYLYLINTDNYAAKQDMLNAIASTNFDVVIMDLFYNEEILTSTEVNSLKTKANGGKRLLISYMNIGSAEKWRYYWKKTWMRHFPCWIKRKYEGYDDEFWVKFWNKNWQEIIYGNDESYMKKILDAGFDGAYLDNVEAYYFLYYRD